MTTIRMVAKFGSDIVDVKEVDFKTNKSGNPNRSATICLLLDPIDMLTSGIADKIEFHLKKGRP